MEIGDIVLVWCYRGYRPGMIKDVGKRKVSIVWADGKQEWIENKRIKVSKDFKDRLWMEKCLKDESRMSEL